MTALRMRVKDCLWPIEDLRTTLITEKVNFNSLFCYEINKNYNNFFRQSFFNALIIHAQENKS